MILNYLLKSWPQECIKSFQPSYPQTKWILLPDRNVKVALLGDLLKIAWNPNIFQRLKKPLIGFIDDS